MVAGVDRESKHFCSDCNRLRHVPSVPNSDSQFTRTITKETNKETSSEEQMKRATRRLLDCAKRDAEKPLFLSRELIDEKNVQSIAESTNPRIGDAFRPHARLVEERIEPY